MNVVLNKILMVTIIFGTVLILAGLPLIMTIQEEAVHFDWVAPFIQAGVYLSGLFNGESFIYMAGTMKLNFLDQVFSYFVASFVYTGIAASTGLILGIVLGILLSRSSWDWLKEVISVLGVLPDFVIVLGLQRLVAYTYIKHGILVAQVATIDWERPAILLPIFTMALIPTIYLVRNLSAHTYQVRTADYILTAKAKGLSRRYIYLNHILRNVIPFLKAELHKIVGITLGNLFIVEYLFNLRGITRLIFLGHGYNLTANTIFVIIMLYFAVFSVLRSIVWVFERIFAYE